ncbi:MAG: hypothetical protein AAF456_16325 [Planctomycetota bacterium]
MPELDPDELLSDEKLEELLRDVDVPDDLAASLRGIPEQHAIEHAATVRARNGEQGLWPLLILAAGIAGIVLSVVWQHSGILDDLSSIASFSAPEDVITEPVIESVETPPTVQVEPVPAVETNETLLAAQSQSDKVLAEIASLQAEIDAQVAQMKTDQMRSELARIQSLAQPISNRDTDSMIRALADQTRISAGGDLEQVSSDMALVIEKYPGSRGAAIATGFLRNNN